jgi:hypothetical protein
VDVSPQGDEGSPLGADLHHLGDSDSPFGGTAVTSGTVFVTLGRAALPEVTKILTQVRKVRIRLENAGRPFEEARISRRGVRVEPDTVRKDVFLSATTVRFLKTCFATSVSSVSSGARRLPGPRVLRQPPRPYVEPVKSATRNHL